MSKKFKAQASSARAASGFGGFGAFQTTASPLSYIAEQPDLSRVNEPNVVVAFKNLGKKDSTTRAKALNELLIALHDCDDVHVLTAWSDLYPRVAIDNSQIVRRHAHVLQGLLTKASGKKIAPLLPKFIPSWLAGTFDSDKSVSKAALEALDQAFPSSDKKAALWKIYKDSIYERVEDALLTQTASSLSDERTTSPDEAEIKYVRVVSNALRLLGHLLQNDFDHAEILREKKLWDFVQHEDSYLRSTVCDLLIVALSKGNLDLDWPVLSTAFIFKGLHTSQTGSMRAFLQALFKLTESRPTVWTTEYTAKASASKRLLQFLRQGSQNGPKDVWYQLVQLASRVPLEAWRHNDDDVNVMAEAYRAGVLKERLNLDSAWHAYCAHCTRLASLLKGDQSLREAFLEEYVLPIVLSYVNKSADQNWRLGSKAFEIAQDAKACISSYSDETYDKMWATAVDDTIEKMRLSLPETSKDFRSSQDAVAAQGRRLLALQSPPNQESGDQAHNTTLLHAAIDILRSRNGKPYGAACILNDLVSAGTPNDPDLAAFLDNELMSLLSTPSGEHLVPVMLQLKKPVGRALLGQEFMSPNTLRATELFLRSAPEAELDDLQDVLFKRMGQFHDDSSRAFTLALLSNRDLKGTQIVTELWQHLIAVLGDRGSQQNGLAMLQTIAASPLLVQQISGSEIVPQLTSQLLVLSGSLDLDIADRATALAAAFSTQENGSSSSLPIIQSQLRGIGDAISILALTDLGLKSLASLDIEDVLLDADEWGRALRPHLCSPSHPSTVINSPLRGAVWVIESNNAEKIHHVIRDQEEFSLLFRITFFYTKVMGQELERLSRVSGSRYEAFAYYYPIALALINEKTNLDAANDLWLGSTDEVLSAALDVVTEGNVLIQTLLEEDSFTQYWLEQWQSIDGASRKTYLEGLAFSLVIHHAMPRQSRTVLQYFEQDLSKVHLSRNMIQSASMLSVLAGDLFGGSDKTIGKKIINELIADITTNPSNFTQVVYLNICNEAEEDVFKGVPQQRLVFLFQKIVNFLREEADGASILSEMFYLTSHLVPSVKDIYGEHWETLAAALGDVWEFLAADDITLLHSSLRVYAELKKGLKSDEVNDDLAEAMAKNKATHVTGLLHCLEALSSTSTEANQPRDITAHLLRRQLNDAIPQDAAALFPLLDSEIDAVRDSAYDLLHKSIPQAQEQLSIELALDESSPALPAELLNLVVDVSRRQGYMLSWKIVYDHYSNASHKLQEVYTANLKSSAHIGPLLVSLCEILRIPTGRPLDASRFDVLEYDIDTPESPEYHTQWLAVHLYYLSLTYTPSLVKDWFLEQKNKIKTPLEAWTQKFITPHIVASNLARVIAWSSTQSKDADDRPVEVKASPRGTEIVASIQVDPESPSISLSISLPSAYPLEPPTVTARTRVGVSEKNFASWLRTIQIIIFSSGSIIEGLVAFRRNVVGALKGQSECAICYSIIGTDMQTPSKKCGTCKNMFHGVCLFRWFKSSNSSSCPLCRNNFNYA